MGFAKTTAADLSAPTAAAGMMIAKLDLSAVRVLQLVIAAPTAQVQDVRDHCA